MDHFKVYNTKPSSFDEIETPGAAYVKDENEAYYFRKTLCAYITQGFSLDDYQDGSRLDYDGKFEYEGKTYYKFLYTYLNDDGERETSGEDEMGFVLFPSLDFHKITYPNIKEVLQGYCWDGEYDIYPIVDEWGDYDIYGFEDEPENMIIIDHYDTSGLDANGIEYVDLALPSGTLWAAYNVGAESPEEYGKYFQWGDTEGYYENESHNFNWSTYKYSNDYGSEFTKYNTGEQDYGGVIDNKLSLDISDDAVRQNFGGDWRMPTRDQMAELAYGTDNEWVEDWEGTGINGRLFTSRVNGNSIFIPASGYRSGSSVYYRGSDARVWSSSLSASYPYRAWRLSFGSGNFGVSGSGRSNGFSLRGVLGFR